MFSLTDSEISSRTVDLIDVVRDQDQNYVAEEVNIDIDINTDFSVENSSPQDLTVYVSSKTARGPLDKDWLETFSQRCVGKQQPTR